MRREGRVVAWKTEAELRWRASSPFAPVLGCSGARMALFGRDGATEGSDRGSR